MGWLKVDSMGKFLRYSLLVLAVLAFVAGIVATDPTGNKALEAGAALALITAVALGIERGQEVFWTAIDSRYGSWWPFSLLTKPVKDLQAQLNKDLPPYITTAKQALADLVSKGQLAQDELNTLNANLDKVNGQLAALTEKGSNAGSLKRTLTSLQNTLTSVQDRIPQGQDALEVGGDVLAILSNVLNSVTDNPARRIISILAGVVAGIIIASLFGLDLFWAVLGKETVFKFTILPGWGVATLHAGVSMTGIIMGLGADPTHQVIRLLEERKKQAKQGNQESAAAAATRAADAVALRSARTASMR